MIYHSVAEIFTEINSARQRLCEGLQELNPRQATFKPSVDKWSVAEILEHLSKVDRVLVSRIGKLLAELEEAEPGVQECAGFVPFSLDSLIERARDQKFKSPEPALPDSGLLIQESLAKLKSSRADLLSMQLRIEARDLSQTTFPHFVFGQLNIYQWLGFIGIHENRHRKQIELIMSAPEFPAS
jgi:uncharacterized damage-inducible protein DinB